jgi:hypothetical protein
MTLGKENRSRKVVPVACYQALQQVDTVHLPVIVPILFWDMGTCIFSMVLVAKLEQAVVLSIEILLEVDRISFQV